MSSSQSAFIKKLQSNCREATRDVCPSKLSLLLSKKKISKASLQKELKPGAGFKYPAWDRLSEYHFQLRDMAFFGLRETYDVFQIDREALARYLIYQQIRLRFTRATLGRRISGVKLYGRLDLIAALRTPARHREEMTLVRELESDIKAAEEKGKDLPPFPIHMPLLFHPTPTKDEVRSILTTGLNLPNGCDDQVLLAAMITYHLDHCDPPKDVYADFFSVGEGTFFPTWLFFCCAIGEIDAGKLQPFVELMKNLDLRPDPLAIAAAQALDEASL